MHKEIIISMVVILIVIIANTLMQSYTQKSVEIMDEKLDMLEESLKSEKEEKIKKTEIEKNLDIVMQDWKERYEKLAFFIEHDELEKVETELTSLRANISVEDYEQAIEPLEKSIFILNHIKEKFRLNMKNMF